MPYAPLEIFTLYPLIIGLRYKSIPVDLWPLCHPGCRPYPPLPHSRRKYSIGVQCWLSKRWPIYQHSLSLSLSLSAAFSLVLLFMAAYNVIYRPIFYISILQLFVLVCDFVSWLPLLNLERLSPKGSCKWFLFPCTWPDSMASCFHSLSLSLSLSLLSVGTQSSTFPP